MERNLRILAAALDGANKAGAFNLHESATIFKALQDIDLYFQTHGEKGYDKDCNVEECESELKVKEKVK